MYLQRNFYLATAAALAISTAAGAQTTVTEDQAMAAMASISMDRSRADVLTFDSAIFQDGSVVLSNVVIHAPDEPVESIDLVKGKPVEADPFTGADSLITEMRFEAPRLDAEGNFLFDSLTMSGLNQTSPDGEASFDLRTLSIDAPSADLAYLISHGFREPDTDIDPEWLENSELMLGGFGMYGMRVTGDDEAVSDIDFAIESIVFSYDEANAMGHFRLEDLVLSGVDSESGPIAMSMREIRIEGVGGEVVGEWADAMTREDVQGFMQSYMETVTLRPADLFRELSISDIQLASSGVEMGLGELAVINEPVGQLIRSTGGIDALRIAPDMSAPDGAVMAASLGQMGYEELSLSARFNTVYDVESGRVYTEGENYYRLEDGFRIDFSSDISGYDRFAETMARSAVVDENDAAATEALGRDILSALTIHEIAFTLTDESFLDRIVSNMSAQQGMPAEQVRAQLSGMAGIMTMGLSQSLGPDLAMDANRSLMNFIQQGGSLTLRVAPEQAASIGELLLSDTGSGAPDFQALGLSFSHAAEQE